MLHNTSCLKSRLQDVLPIFCILASSEYLSLVDGIPPDVELRSGYPCGFAGQDCEIAVLLHSVTAMFHFAAILQRLFK